jgi:hypothetical protein
VYFNRSPIEATRLRFDQGKKSLYSRVLVKPSVRNAASPIGHQRDHDAMTTRHELSVVDFFLDRIGVA